MNVIKKNSFTKLFRVISIFALLLFIAILFALAVVFVNFNLPYTLPATLAVISFTISLMFLIRNKHISIHSIMALIVGFLFLASSIIEYGFSVFTQNMSILNQIEFSRIMRPTQASRGLEYIGLGLASLLTNFSYINVKKSSEINTHIQYRKISKISQLGFGIFFFFFGIYMIINGLQPL